MTPEGRQDLAAVIAEMRLDHRSKVHRWADRLALLLAEAPQVHETKEDTDTRVGAMGDSTDNPTASEHETTPATVTPNHVSHEARYRQWLVDEADSARAPERWEAYDDALRAFDAMVLAAPAPVTQGRIEAGDVPETTTDNPQSWIAWKRRALAAETALREVVTNGEWRGGVEWVISTAVYEMASEALAALLETRGVPQEEKDQENDTRVVDSQYDPPSAGPLATAAENKLGPNAHWAVTVERSGQTVVTIEPRMLCGRELLPGDEDAIRSAAMNLLGFIGGVVCPVPSFPTGSFCAACGRHESEHVRKS